METFIDEKGLYNYLERPLNDLLKMTRTDTEHKEIIQNDKKCKNYIVQMIEDMQLEYIKGFATSFEMWDNLKNIFQGKGLSSKLFLKKRLLMMKLK